MAKITVKSRPLHHRHRAWLSKYTSDFIAKLAEANVSDIPDLLQRFPGDWPFPRGDLHVWIPVLDRFDVLLQKFTTFYRLRDGPQTQPFSDKLQIGPDLDELQRTPEEASPPYKISEVEPEPDRRLIQDILGFTKLLLDHCGNRSLYNSGEYLNDLLNSTSLELVEATLGVAVCLAQRYHASIIRNRSYVRGGNSAFAMASSVDQLVSFASQKPDLLAPLPASKNGPLQKTRGKTNSSELLVIGDSSLLSLALPDSEESIHLSSGLRFTYQVLPPRSGQEGNEQGKSRETKAAVSNALARTSPRRTSASASRVTAEESPTEPGAGEPLATIPAPTRLSRQATEPSTHVLQIKREEILSRSLPDLVAKYAPILPQQCKGEFLLAIRSASSLLRPKKTNGGFLKMKLLSLIVLAHVLPEGEFEKRVLAHDSDQPRRRQLAFQLVDLVKKNPKSEGAIPLKLQSLTADCLEALMRQRRRALDVTSAMITYVNHGVPSAILRQVLDDINSHPVISAESVEYGWQGAIFLLLSKLVSELDRIAEGLISAGAFTLLVQAINGIKSPGRELAICQLLGFLDHLIHSTRNGFQVFANGEGLQALSSLIARQVHQADERRASYGLPDKYRSVLADYQIPPGEQTVLRSVFKLISHAFSHSGHGFDRLLRNLVDSNQLLTALRQIIEAPTEYGSAVWSAAVTSMVNFIHHEPTSYTVIAEAGLSQAFINCMTPQTGLKYSYVKNGPMIISDVKKGLGDHIHAEPGEAGAVEAKDSSSEFVFAPSPVPAGLDAMMAAAQAFEAICLNAAGLAMVERSTVLTNFLLIFASARHVPNISSDSGFAFKIGSTFNELLRHYPSLRVTILAAIDATVQAVNMIANSEDDSVHKNMGTLYSKSLRFPGDPQHNVPSVATFIEQLSQFLKAFLGHPSHSSSFIKAGGAEGLLDLCTASQLPYDFSHCLGSRSLSQLILGLVDQKPHLVLPSLIERLHSAVNSLEPYLRSSADGAFIGRFVGSGPLIEDVSSSLDYKALLAVQTLSAVLNRESQPSAYDRRSRDSAIAQVNLVDRFESMLPLLGELLLACPRDFSRLKKLGHQAGHELPSARANDTNPDHPPSDNDEGAPGSTSPLLPSAALSERPIDVKVIERGEHGSTVSASGLSTIATENLRILNALLSSVPETVTQFLHHVCKSIIGKRQTEISARHMGSKVVEAIASLLVSRLELCRHDFWTDDAFKYPILMSTLSLANRLLFDEGRHGRQAFTSVLRAFSNKHGLELLDVLLNRCWGDLPESSAQSLQIGDRSLLSARDPETRVHCINMILELYAWMSTSSYILEVPQSLELLARSSDRNSSDSFRPAVFLVELRTTIMSRIGPVWRSDLISRVPTCVVKRLLETVRVLLEGDGEGGGIAPQSFRPATQARALPSFEVNTELLTGLNDENQTPSLNREALLRCYNVYALAREYAEVHAAHPRLRRSPIPIEGIVTPAIRSDNTSTQIGHEDTTRPQISIEQSRSGMLEPSLVVETPELISQFPNESDQPSRHMQIEQHESGIVDQTGTEMLDMRADIESLLHGLTMPITGEASALGAAPSLDPAVKPAGPKSGSNNDPATANTLREPIEPLRLDLLSDAIDRCVTILSSHGDVIFEMLDFLRDAIVMRRTPTESADKMREELALTLIQSLLSLYSEDNDDLKQNQGQIAALAHLIALLLQLPRFAECAISQLRDNLDELLLFVRLTTNHSPVSASWVVYLLLVLEKLCTQCFQPHKTEWTGSMGETETMQLLSETEKPFLSEEVQMKILKLLIGLLPRIKKDARLAMQVCRVLAILTKNYSLATLLAERQNLQHLFMMIKHLAGVRVDRVHALVVLIFRHMIEDTPTLTQIMRTEIQQCLETRQSPRSQIDLTQYLRSAAHLILRQPQIFLRLTAELVHIPKMDNPTNAHTRSHSIVLLSKSYEETSEIPPSSSRDDVLSAQSTDIPDSHQFSPSMTPVGVNQDSVTPVLLTELLACRDVEEKVSEESGSSATNLNSEDPSEHNSIDPASTKSAVEFKPEQHPSYIYRCFLLASLTELLASYNKVKTNLIMFSRKSQVSEVFTQNKPRTGMVAYLINDMLPLDSIEYIGHTDIIGCKRKVTSRWTMAALVALCAKTGENRIDEAKDNTSGVEEPELLTVRRFTLDQVQKAYKECVQIPGSASRYAKMLTISDLINNMLEYAPSAGGGSHMDALSALSQKQLARLMFEKNFIRSFTESLADINYAFPMIERVVKYILKTIRLLADLVHQLSQTSSLAHTEATEIEEISSVSSSSGSGEDREDTPDLFRHSALGIIDPNQDESASSMSDDEEEDEVFGEEYEEELEYDDPMDDDEEGEGEDDGEAASDNSQAIEAVPGDHPVDIGFGLGQHGTSTSSDSGTSSSEAEDEDEDEDDEDDVDVDMVDMNEDSNWQEEAIDGPDVEMEMEGDDYPSLGNAFEHSSSDEGPHGIPSDLPITSLLDSFQGEFVPMLDLPHPHAEAHEFSDDDAMEAEEEEHYSELDEDEEMEYEDGNMEDEEDPDIFLPTGPITLPQHMYFDPDEHDYSLSRAGHRHAARVAAHSGRHTRGGRPWFAFGSGELAPPGHYRTSAHARRPHDDDGNPLLRPDSGIDLAVSRNLGSHQISTGSTDLSRLISTMLMDQRPGQIENPGRILDSLLGHLRDGSGVGVHRHNGTLHFSISEETGSLRTEVQAMLRNPSALLERAPTAREPLLDFYPSVTSARWHEEARLLYGSQTTDIARRVENAVLAILVPAAIKAEQERERKKRAKEELEIAELQRKRQADEEAAAAAAEEVETAEGSEPTAQSTEAIGVASASNPEISASSGDVEQQDQAVHPDSEPNDVVAHSREPSPTAEIDLPTTTSAERVTTSLRGQELDITGMDIDPGFLDALPDELREEVLMQHIADRRQREAVTGGQPTEINREFLNALPADIREEVLRTEAQERRRQERAAAQQPSSGHQRQAAEMDPASFLASLQPELRQTVLAEGDDEFIDQLPPELAAEARALRRPRRAPNFQDPYVSMVDHHARPNQQDVVVRQDTGKISTVRMLDQRGVAALLRLLFLPHDRQKSSSLSKILLTACNNRQDREEILGLAIAILQGVSTDEQSVETTYAQLASRSRRVDDDETSTLAAAAIKARPPPTPPSTLTQHALYALLSLAEGNTRVPSFFLTEHDSHLALQVESRKGKSRSSRATRFPVNMLLSLLDRATLTESNGAMETFSSLLALITNPLRSLIDRAPADSTQPESSNVASVSNEAAVTNLPHNEVPNPDSSIAEVDSAEPTGSTEALAQSLPNGETPASISRPDESHLSAKEQLAPTENGDQKKTAKKSMAPTIPEANLRLVVSVLAGKECSSHTFKQILQSMESLLVVPGAVSVFGSELVKQAQQLASGTLASLDGMVTEMQHATKDVDFQNIRFSTASLDQTKLLRVLTALDFLFDPKKQMVANHGDDGLKELVRPNLVAPLFEMTEFILLWQRLGFCLTIIREKENLQSLAGVLLPLIESLMVVCKNTTINDQANPNIPSDRAPMLSPAPDSQMEHLFYAFTEEHRKVLNNLVRSNPRLMSGSFALLVKNPKVLEFDNKRNYFTRQMHSRAAGIRQNYHSLSLNIRRDYVFMDTYRSMYFKSADEIKYAKLNIRFNGEEGVDAGGVTREWFSALSRQMFNPDYALFLPVAGDRTTFHPNNLSSVNDEHLLYFKFIGRVIGKALYEGKVLDCHFSRAVYRRILGKAVSIKDMESIDLDYYRSLMWILQNPITDIITETFSIESDDFGVKTILDLVPEGRNIAVTEENKQEYVRLVTEHRLTGSVKEQLENFLIGFHDIVPPELISIFNEQELELLISGLPEIDVDDWKANTEYHSYSASSPQIQWFWRAVRSFDKEEKAKLLQFITGTSRVPLNGFRELEGMHGFSRFNIHRDPTSKDRLPSSHTCFNQLDLPEYESYDSLRRNVILAFTAGGEYFGFA